MGSGTISLPQLLNEDLVRQRNIVKQFNKKQEAELYHEYENTHFMSLMLEAGDHVDQIESQLTALADNLSLLEAIKKRSSDFLDCVRSCLEDRVFRTRMLLTFLLEQQKKVCDLGIQLIIHGPSYCEVEGGPLKFGYKDCLASIGAKKDIVDTETKRHKNAQRDHRDDPDMIAEIKDRMDRAKAKYDIAIQRKDEILGDLRRWREDCDYKNVIQELVGPAIVDSTAFPSESGEAKTDIENQEIKKASLESLDDSLNNLNEEAEAHEKKKQELIDKMLALTNG